MENQRLPPITKRMADESDTRRFRFIFYCERCGVGYQTADIRFSIRDAPEKLVDFTNPQRLIWNAEHEDAYERGNRSALLAFSPCEDCGRMVCEICAGELESDTVCHDCRENRARKS